MFMETNGFQSSCFCCVAREHQFWAWLSVIEGAAFPCCKLFFSHKQLPKSWKQGWKRHPELRGQSRIPPPLASNFDAAEMFPLSSHCGAADGPRISYLEIPVPQLRNDVQGEV